MAMNNVNIEAMGKFIDAVKVNPQAGKKVQQIVGVLDYTSARPQFEAVLEFKQGSEKVQADLVSFMGGAGLSPDPIQYSLFGTASSYAGTFMALAAKEGIALSQLKVTARNEVDLSQSLGLTHNPIVGNVKIIVEVKTGVAEAKIRELQRLAAERCPAVYALTNAIKLETELKLAAV